MSNQSFVSVVQPLNYSRGSNNKPAQSGQGRSESAGAGAWARRLLIVDAYLWIAFGLNLALIALERLFGIVTGFTVWLGAAPAILLSAALIFGGAWLAMRQAPAFMAYWRRRGAPAQRSATRATMASETASPGAWRTRTKARSATPYTQRSAAARRVMEAQI